MREYLVDDIDDKVFFARSVLYYIEDISHAHAEYIAEHYGVFASVFFLPSMFRFVGLLRVGEKFRYVAEFNAAEVMFHYFQLILVGVHKVAYKSFVFFLFGVYENYIAYKFDKLFVFQFLDLVKNGVQKVAYRYSVEYSEQIVFLFVRSIFLTYAEQMVEQVEHIYGEKSRNGSVNRLVALVPLTLDRSVLEV